MLKKILQKNVEKVLTHVYKNVIVCNVDKTSTQNIVRKELQRMVNTQLLECKINDSGKTKTFLSGKLGVSIQTFKKKCSNEAEFKVSEMFILCKELDINVGREQEKIFFA